ncbi:MAG: four helix bundle protein [Candidatus Absconditabacterales bacterium]
MAILENIEVWKKSVQLGKDIYAICRNTPQIKNDFGIRDQLQRSAVSIASNIAEGNDRESDKEYARFLYIARGSCSELKTQLYIIEEYLDPKDLENSITKIIEIHKMLNGLIKTIKTNI